MASSSSEKTIIAFDLYGTLLSTESVAKELAKHFGEERANEVATLWRRYQLEYTWRMNSMGLYTPFGEITRTSLLHALAESDLTLSDSDISSLMKAYDSLGTFPDVPTGLDALKSMPNIQAHVFSNGTNAMVSSSVHSSPSLSPYASIFKSLITIEQVSCYKPAPAVYHHLAREVGKDPLNEKEMGSLWLVSGNPFDVVGARAMGMQACWIDRAGGHHGNGGWNDRLEMLMGGREVAGPTIVVKGVDEAVKGIQKWVEEGKGKGPKLDREKVAGGPTVPEALSLRS